MDKNEKAVANDNFFKVLFDEGDSICAGSMYTSDVGPICSAPGPEFFSVNPLALDRDHLHFLKDSYDENRGRRADMNVTSYRNFVFEMDSIPVDDQLAIYEACRIPFSTLVYSGGKSVHAVLSLEEPLDVEPHTQDGVMYYKKVWERLAAAIDWDAKAAGYSLPDGKPSFVDSACKNPSRFTRFPNSIRNNGEEQSLLMVGSRISNGDFGDLLVNCPKVFKSLSYEMNVPEKEIVTEDEFWACCPVPLANSLKNVDWAGREGMYPILYRLTLWAIDSTGVTRDLLCAILDKHTFPRLVAGGYPTYKLTKAVEHAFASKGVY